MDAAHHVRRYLLGEEGSGSQRLVCVCFITAGPITKLCALVWRLTCAGRLTSRRDFAPFSSATHRAFHGERAGTNDHGGWGMGAR